MYATKIIIRIIHKIDLMNDSITIESNVLVYCRFAIENQGLIDCEERNFQYIYIYQILFDKE